MATLKEFASSDGVSKIPDAVNTGSTKRPKDQTDGQKEMNSETKAEALKQLMAHASTLGKSDIDNIFKGASALGGGNAHANRKADQSGGEPMTTVQNYWAKEDIDDLFVGDQFSEDFKEKIAVIFEAAVGAKLAIIEAELTEQFQTALDEQVAEINESVKTEVNDYLSYVAEAWVDNNKLEIEANAKVDLAESFMTQLRDLFEAHDIDISDEQVDLVAELEESNDELVDKYNTIYEDNINLRKAIIEYQKDDIFAEITEGMVSTQCDKLFTLAESINYADLDDYKSKLETLKESVVGKVTITAPKAPSNLNEDFVSDTNTTGMTAYKAASARLAKK